MKLPNGFWIVAIGLMCYGVWRHRKYLRFWYREFKDQLRWAWNGIKEKR